MGTDGKYSAVAGNSKTIKNEKQEESLVSFSALQDMKI